MCVCETAWCVVTWYEGNEKPVTGIRVTRSLRSHGGLCFSPLTHLPPCHMSYFLCFCSRSCAIKGCMRECQAMWGSKSEWRKVGCFLFGLLDGGSSQVGHLLKVLSAILSKNKFAHVQQIFPHQLLAAWLTRRQWRNFVGVLLSTQAQRRITSRCEPPHSPKPQQPVRGQEWGSAPVPFWAGEENLQLSTLVMWHRWYKL